MEKLENLNNSTGDNGSSNGAKSKESNIYNQTHGGNSSTSNQESSHAHRSSESSSKDYSEDQINAVKK